MKDIKYEGYIITTASIKSSNGVSFVSSSTVQVRRKLKEGYYLHKAISFTWGNKAQHEDAISRAKSYCDCNPLPKQKVKT